MIRPMGVWVSEKPKPMTAHKAIRLVRLPTSGTSATPATIRAAPPIIAGRSSSRVRMRGKRNAANIDPAPKPAKASATASSPSPSRAYTRTTVLT